MISRKIFSELAEIILEGGAVSAIKFFNAETVVKATRRRGKKIDKLEKHVEILFSIGSPNLKERQMIRWGTKPGNPGPYKRIHITWPKKKGRT